MSTDAHAPVKKLVDAHFAGRISADRERELRSHLARCGECRAYYNRHLVLAELDPSATSAQARIAGGLGLSIDKKPPRVPTLAWATAALAIAAVLAIVPRSSKRSDEFTARGVQADALDPQVLVYQVAKGALPHAPQTTIGASDELAFAYANSPGFRRLMIFGVDEHRHVYWYHPAWSDEALDPHGIEIARGADVREIPEAIRHSIDGHELVVLAIFTNDDLSVRQVEQMVKNSAFVGQPLPIQKSYQKTFHFDVER